MFTKKNFCICIALILILLLSGTAFAVKKDMAMFTRLAKKGNLTAQEALAKYYYYGSAADPYVEQDYEQAAYWSSKAAIQGSRAAKIYLSDVYFEGKGVKQDYKKAFDMYTELGSEYKLGMMYENGYGVQTDIQKAIEYYNKVAHEHLSGRPSPYGEKAIAALKRLGIDTPQINLQQAAYTSSSNNNVSKVTQNYQQTAKPTRRLTSDEFNYLCQNGSVQDLKAVFNEVSVNDILSDSKYGVTPLMQAAYHRRIKVMKLLLELGARVDIEDKVGDTALTYTVVNAYANDFAKAEEAIQLLMKHGAKMTDQVFVKSVCRRYFIATNLAEILLKYGANINARDSRGRGSTVLMYGAMWHDVPSVSNLLRMGADPNIQDNDGRRAVDYARERMSRANNPFDKKDCENIIQMLLNASGEESLRD